MIDDEIPYTDKILHTATLPSKAEEDESTSKSIMTFSTFIVVSFAILDISTCIRKTYRFKI